MTPDEATRRFYAHVWPHRAVVLRTAQFLCGRAHEADDLAQETLLKAFRAIETFDALTNAQAWLMTILRNTHIDRLRANARHPAHVGSQELDEHVADTRPAQSAGELLDFQSLLEQLSDAHIIAGLRQLPGDISWTLLLVDVQQMPYDQAAVVLGIPEGTVKSRVHRGRQMLRDALIRRTPEPGDSTVRAHDGGYRS